MGFQIFATIIESTLKKEMVKSEEIIKNYIDLKAKLTSVDIGFKLDDVITELDICHAEEIKKMII